MAKKEITKKEQVEIKNEIVDNLKEQVLYDLDKAIKTSIKNNTENYKKEIKEELISDLTEELNNAIKREEKRFIRGKNIALLKKNIIIILLLCIIGYFGYCLYDVKYFKFMQSECTGEVCNKKPVENESDKQETEVIKDEKWYIENYSYLLNASKITLSANNINAYYLYSGDHNTNEIKSSYLLNMAYNNLESSEIKTSSSSIVVSNEAMQNAFHKTFYDLEYQPTNFNYGCLNFLYNENRERYTADNNKCENNTTEIIENIETIYEEDEKIYIVTNATIYENEDKSCYAFDDLFNPILTDIEKEEISDNSKKINKYQYEYELIDGNYYLTSISKLK